MSAVPARRWFVLPRFVASRPVDRRVGQAAAAATIETLEGRVLLSGSLPLPPSILTSPGAVFDLSYDPITGNTLTISAGVVVFNANVGAPDGDLPNLAVHLSGTADAAFNAPEVLTGLSLSGTAKLTLTSSGGGSSGNYLRIGQGGLSMPGDPNAADPSAPTATLDLKDNQMLLENPAGASGLNPVQALIAHAFDVNTRAWDAADLTSSDAHSALADGPRTTLAYGLSGTMHNTWSSSNTFAGVVPAPDDILVTLALVGDMDLDGYVGNIDLGAFKDVYGSTGGTYETGAYTFDSVCGATDFGWFRANFGLTLLGPNAARTLLPVGLPISAVEGQPLSNVKVATFTDTLNTVANPTNPGDYLASVDFGDGNFVTANVALDADPNDPGGFVVMGTSPFALSNPNALIVMKVQYTAASGLQGRPASLGEPIVSVTPALSGLSAVPVSVSQINLYWTLNATNATSIEVARSIDGGAYATLAASAGGSATLFTDTTVSEGHVYSYQIRAVQPIGDSAYSGPATATTHAVQGLYATAVSTTGIDLSWLNLSTDPNATVDVQRAPFGTSDFTTIASGLPAGTSSYSDVTGLSEGTHWSYQVLLHEPGVTGMPTTLSDPADTWTLPAGPVSLTVTSTASGEVDLSWANGSASSPGFLVERSTDNLAFEPVDQVGPGTSTYADTSVADGTTYYYQVIATNDGGDSGPSNTATTPTPLAAPALSASASSASQIDLTWQNNSRTATGFTILRSLLPTSGFAPVNMIAGATATSWSDTGLTAGTHYYYQIEATAGALTSPASNVADDTTVPPTPMGVNVTAASATELDVSWLASPGATGYLVQRQDAAGWSDVADLDASTLAYHDTGLLDGTTHSYRVSAYNAAGLSSASTSASNTSTLTVPFAPSGVQAIALSSGAVQVIWRDESHDESGYRVERSIAGTSAWTAVGTTLPGVTTLADNSSSLIAGTSYDYRVFATNAAGDSGPATAQALTLPRVPVAQAPTAVTASLTAGVGGNTLSVNWTPGAGTAYQYEVQVTPVSFSGADASPGGSAMTLFTASTAATLTLPNSYLSVSPADYFVAVRAVSASGVYSPWGAMLDAGRTAPDPNVTPPMGTPTNIQAAGTGGTPTITFDLPQGENDVTAVELTATGPGLTVPKVTGFTYPPTGSGQGIGISLPLPNSTYSITVKVYNAGGYGGSGAVSFTTGNFTPPASQPTSLQATKVTATEADVSWSGTQWPGVSLHAYSDPFGINEVYGTITGSGTSATITNLPANTPLWLQLGSAGTSGSELRAPFAVTTLASASPAPTALDPDAKEIAPDGLPQAGDLLFTRTGDLNQPADVPITLTGTTPGSGYKLVDAYTGQIVTGSVNFPIGFSNKVIEVIPINDGTAQWTRTVTATEGTSATVQTDPTPATVGIEGGNFAVTLGDGSDNQILQASTDGMQNLVPLALTLPTTIVPGATVTLTVHSPVGIDVWGTATPQPGDTPLNGTGTSVTWTEGTDPGQAIPAVVWAGATDGSTQIASTWFTLICTDAPAQTQPVHPTRIATNTNPDSTISVKILSQADPNNDTPNGSNVTGKQARKWIVGQVADLVAQLDGPPADIAHPNYNWVVTGNALHSYKITDTTAQAYGLQPNNANDDPTQQDREIVGTAKREIRFFWVSTDANAPGFDPRVITLTVTVGGKARPAATGFSVYRPSASEEVTGTGTSRISATKRPNGTFNFFAELTGDGPVNGIETTATVNAIQGFQNAAAEWAFMQKVKTTENRVYPAPVGSRTLNLNGREDVADGPLPYAVIDGHGNDPGIFAVGSSHRADDNPSDPLNSVVSTMIDQKYTLYVMYKPPGLQSQWVPLKNLNWIWQITTGEDKSRPSGQKILKGSGPEPSKAVDANFEPTWSTLVKSGIFQSAGH